MFMLAAAFLTTCQTIFSEMPCPQGLPARQDTSEQRATFDTG